MDLITYSSLARRSVLSETSSFTLDVSILRAYLTSFEIVKNAEVVLKYLKIQLSKRDLFPLKYIFFPKI